MTNPIADILAGAAARAGLPAPTRIIPTRSNHLDVHVPIAALEQWRGWCDLVAIEADSITTPVSMFTYGKGRFRGYAVILYGHGVPALRYAERVAEDPSLPPFGAPLT